MVFPVTNSVVPTGTRSTENSLATIKVLDTPAQGRASIFPQEDGAPGRNGINQAFQLSQAPPARMIVK